jgi:branched-chain amino acid transport system substrate-binding protein
VSRSERAGIRIASESYARNDQSVTTKLKMISPNRRGKAIAAVGGPAALPQATLYDQSRAGLPDARWAPTNSSSRQGKGRRYRARRRSMLVIDDVAPTDPIRKSRSPTSARTRSSSGSGRRFGANTLRCGLLLQQAIPVALKAAKPGTEAFRSALRDALAAAMSPAARRVQYEPDNHNGMDERARVLIIVRDGSFRLLPE